MRNSIFKSYTKKILRSEAFISVIIVFVLALGIIGTSYALYMDVDTDTNYQLVEVGDLSIGFDNGENTITLENMTPMEDEIALSETKNIFSFYIYNTGTYTSDYEIKLVPDNTNGNTIAPEYINYQICKDNSENCTEVKTLGTNSLIYTDALSPKRETDASNPSAYYFLRLWINNLYTETNGGTIKYNVEISAKNASGYLDNKNTLAGAILNNPNITINNNVLIFNGIADYKVTGDATSGELGLFKAEDDYGISYYFRGAQSNNYVNFAGFTWRVVRINGDGSIRLILDGSLDKVTKENETQAVYKNEKLLSIDADGKMKFNDPHNDNAYIGYMYGTVPSTSYKEAHENKQDSLIKRYIDVFYEEYILGYQKYLNDTLFCNDKSIADKTIGNNTTEGFSTKNTLYKAAQRLRYKKGTTLLTVATPTLECVKENGMETEEQKEYNIYSRFTSQIDMSESTNKGVLVNNDLKYPIGLLTADEVSFAGGWFDTVNSSFYLNDPYLYDSPLIGTYFWLMSPNGGSSASSGFLSGSGSLSLRTLQLYNYGAVRPVINLRKDVLISGGNGTKTTPYTINYN